MKLRNKEEVERERDLREKRSTPPPLSLAAAAADK